jgi:hypothetical protein
MELGHLLLPGLRVLFHRGHVTDRSVHGQLKGLQPHQRAGFPHVSQLGHLREGVFGVVVGLVDHAMKSGEAHDAHGQQE